MLSICFYDIYHAYMMNEDDKPLRRAIDYVKLVHTAHDIAGKRHYLRRDDIDNQRIFFDALLECGFGGEVSMEASVTQPIQSAAEILFLFPYSERKQ